MEKQVILNATQLELTLKRLSHEQFLLVSSRVVFTSPPASKRS
jgi:hypothetical protein